MKTYLSIEISEQKVRYLIVEQNGKGLGLKGAGGSTLQVGPSAPGALASYIKELVASQKLKVDRLFLTVNRRDIVVHQFNLGQVSKDDLAQIIPAEIEKIPSFADNDFDYVYRQYENKSRNNIIFGAMTDEINQYLLKEIKQTRIPCQEMELVPLNLPGLLNAPEFEDGPQALIALSDHVTYLVVFEAGQIRYLYSTTVGDEILGDRFPCINWGEELKRALKAFSLDSKQTVNKVWLLWDKDKAPDFDGFLREELNINAQPLNLLQKWFTKDINPVYTLAAVPLIYHLNKIKPSFSLNHFLRGSQLFAHMSRIAVVGGLLILITGVALGCIVGRFYKTEYQAVEDTRHAQAQMLALQQESAEILRQHDAYLAMRRELLFQATYVRYLKNMSWSRALSVVAFEMPHRLSLTSFKVDEMGGVTFAGEAFRMESIAKLLRTIEVSKILDQGQFSYLTQEDVEKKKVFRFGILANIKQGDHS